jgi:hypothetical protein
MQWSTSVIPTGMTNRRIVVQVILGIKQDYIAKITSANRAC